MSEVLGKPFHIHRWNFLERQLNERFIDGLTPTARLHVRWTDIYNRLAAAGHSRAVTSSLKTKLLTLNNQQ